MDNNERLPLLESTIDTVEMTEVDGIQQGAVHLGHFYGFNR